MIKLYFQSLLITIALLSSAMAFAHVPPEKSLIDFNWKYRLLVTDIISDTQLDQLQQQIGHHQQDIKARQLVWLIRYRNSVFRLNPSVSAPLNKQSTTEVLSQQVSSLLGKYPNKVILIGLDGVIKAHYPADNATLEKIFAEIDLMPMRRVEINR